MGGSLALLLALLLAVAGAAPVGGGREAAPEHVPVLRLSGPDRAGTAAAITEYGWPEGPDSVVLADGWSPVEALLAAHLAARLDAPLLLSGAEHVPSATTAALQDAPEQAVTVIGGAAVPAGTDVIRIRAEDPIVLAAELAALPDRPVGTAVIVNAAAPADALAAANLAPAVVLLTDPQTLSPPTAAAIDALAPERIVVVGGESVVSEAVLRDLRAITTSPVERTAGPSRVQTALAAAVRTGSTVALAAADAVADAIAAVPLVARHRGSLLLNPHDELHEDVDSRLRGVDHAGAAVILGGEAALGNFVPRQVTAAVTGLPPPGFSSTVRALTATERADMTGVTWHDGCPVTLDDLVDLAVDHWDRDGNVRRGHLVVAADHAVDVEAILRAAFDARFPLQQVAPARLFGGDDVALMDANVTSAFNCRAVAGTSTWSQHAYGTAVDVNPVQNPYVRGDEVQPPAGAAHLDRGNVRPGMLVEGDAVVAAADERGWGWGGRWVSLKDYQHLSASGR